MNAVFERELAHVCDKEQITFYGRRPLLNPNFKTIVSAQSSHKMATVKQSAIDEVDIEKEKRSHCRRKNEHYFQLAAYRQCKIRAETRKNEILFSLRQDMTTDRCHHVHIEKDELLHCIPPHLTIFRKAGRGILII